MFREEHIHNSHSWVRVLADALMVDVACVVVVG